MTNTIDLSQSIDLSARFLKVAVPVKMIGNTKQLKAEAQEIEARHNAHIGQAVKANKTLYGDALKAVSTARNSVVTKHRALTCVWNDSSWRLLSSSKWFDYANELNPLIAVFDTCVSDLAGRFDDLVRDAEERLGTLFDRNDYPVDGDDFRSSFRIEIMQEPLPRIEDAHRISLPMAELESMQRSMERAYADNINRVQSENFNKIYEVATSLRDSLKSFASGEQSTVKKTLLDTIEKTCCYCTEFNLSGDSYLAGLVEAVRNSLLKYDMEEVRASEAKQNQVIAAADSIADRAAKRRAMAANVNTCFG